MADEDDNKPTKSVYRFDVADGRSAWPLPPTGRSGGLAGVRIFGTGSRGSISAPDRKVCLPEPFATGADTCIGRCGTAARNVTLMRGDLIAFAD